MVSPRKSVKMWRKYPWAFFCVQAISPRRLWLSPFRGSKTEKEIVGPPPPPPKVSRVLVRLLAPPRGSICRVSRGSVALHFRFLLLVAHVFDTLRQRCLTRTRHGCSHTKNVRSSGSRAPLEVLLFAFITTPCRGLHTPQWSLGLFTLLLCSLMPPHTR